MYLQNGFLIKNLRPYLGNVCNFASKILAKSQSCEDFTTIWLNLIFTIINPLLALLVLHSYKAQSQCQEWKKLRLTQCDLRIKHQIGLGGGLNVCKTYYSIRWWLIFRTNAIPYCRNDFHLRHGLDLYN